MAEHGPVLIAVAPNGARKSKADHACLPLCSEELADTAVACLEAGAAMIHLHVRDSSGKHSIMPEHYGPALEAIEQAVGEQMIVQVTSEAANIFDRHQQMEAMRSLMPAYVSIALRELVPDESAFEEAASFFSDLTANGSLIQYILYSPEEVTQYHQLIESQVIPRPQNLILFVLGRYENNIAELHELEPYINCNKSESPWMCCAFGRNEQTIMRRVLELGGHARVGFENNMQLETGKVADSNSHLVAMTASAARNCERPIANAKWLQRLRKGLLKPI